jgi:hypothetical protein
VALRFELPPLDFVADFVGAFFVPDAVDGFAADDFAPAAFEDDPLDVDAVLDGLASAGLAVALEPLRVVRERVRFASSPPGSTFPTTSPTVPAAFPTTSPTAPAALPICFVAPFRALPGSGMVVLSLATLLDRQALTDARGMPPNR